MSSALQSDSECTQQATTQAVHHLSGAFVANSLAFPTEDDIRSGIYNPLSAALLSERASSSGSFPLVQQEYATPFKCHTGDLRFEVLDDESLGARRHNGVVVLNPWWTERAPVEALKNEDFEVFRGEIRDKA